MNIKFVKMFMFFSCMDVYIFHQIHEYFGSSICGGHEHVKCSKKMNKFAKNEKIET